RSFCKSGLLLGIGFLVSPTPGLPLDTMFLEEPPERLAVLVADAPFSLQILARILHGRDVSRSHGLQQALPRLRGQPRRLPGWLVLLEHLCQAFCPIAFPPTRQLAHAIADHWRAVLQTLHRSAFEQSQYTHPIRCFLSSSALF